MRLNDWIIAKTNATRAAPIAMPYDLPRLASSTGSRAQESAAVSTTVPSVMAVRVTTSSIVIAPERAGACGAPYWVSCWAYGFVAYGLAVPCAYGLVPAVAAPACGAALKPA